MFSEGETLIHVHWESDHFTVYTPTGAHVHADTQDEALEVSWGLLTGEIRYALEYRGETLARSWIEEREGDRYSVGDSSVYLNVWDRDEWELWPGEKWKQIRNTIRLTRDPGAPLIESFERFSEEPNFPKPDMLSWLENGLGPAKPSMKWAVGRSNLFIHQAPRGWRRKTPDQGDFWVNYAPPRSGLMFRAQNFFRDAEPRGSEARRPIGPYSIGDVVQTQEGVWIKRSWTVLFTDGVEEAMGVLDLFSIAETEPHALELIPQIEASLSECLFIGEEWDCKRTP